MTVQLSRKTMTQINRRLFLKGMAAGGATGLFAPNLLLSQTGQVSPNERVNLACCGIGGQGEGDIRTLDYTGLANIVALCDTDLGSAATQPILDSYPNAAKFQDFRRMFDTMANQIDAVLIATPDHSHFPIAMLAMSLGKHVYVEKPLAHSYRQIDLMMKAEKTYKVAAQMGNQGHSGANYFQFKTWMEAGVIKNVTRIIAFMNNSRRWHGMTASDFLPEQPIPETLDWETWNATAKQLKYNKGYTRGDWRSWYDLGNGALGDWGAHIFDAAHEFLNLGLPTEIDPLTIQGHSPYIFPQASTLAFRFPARGDMPPCELTWYDGQQNLPPLPEAFGPIRLNSLPPGKVIISDTLTFKGGTHDASLRIIPREKAQDLASTLPRVPKSPSNHYKNFLLACKGQETCRSSFDVAGPLSKMMALGVIAQRVNARLTFDRATERITNHATANELLKGVPPRKEWEQFYQL